MDTNLNAMNTENDVHSLTACLLLGKQTVTPQERRLGKKISYGIMYGMDDIAIHRLLEKIPNG